MTLHAGSWGAKLVSEPLNQDLRKQAGVRVPRMGTEGEGREGLRSLLCFFRESGTCYLVMGRGGSGSSLQSLSLRREGTQWTLQCRRRTEPGSEPGDCKHGLWLAPGPLSRRVEEGGRGHGWSYRAAGSLRGQIGAPRPHPRGGARLLGCPGRGAQRGQRSPKLRAAQLARVGRARVRARGDGGNRGKQPALGDSRGAPSADP